MSSHRIENHVLRTLPPEEYERISHQLTPIEFAAGTTLFSPANRAESVYFINTGMIAMLGSTSSGDSVELAHICQDGVAGHFVARTGGVFPYTLRTLLSGKALWMGARHFDRAMEENERFRARINGYLKRLIEQIARAGVCNAFHPAEERLCRWLLHAHDCAAGDVLPLTHELMAETIGIRRNRVSFVLRTLQRAGLIHVRRGSLAIADRAGLEACACECYAAMRPETQESVPSPGSDYLTV